MAPHLQFVSHPMSERHSSFRNPGKGALVNNSRSLGVVPAPAPHFPSELACACPDSQPHANIVILKISSNVKLLFLPVSDEALCEDRI
jgi:hypothetical protein